MANIAKLANGTLLKKGSGASVETFTTVPGCKRLRGPSTRFDLLDVSDHDTVGLYKEYIPGMADGDQIRGELNWRPSNTIHKGIRVDADAGTLRNYKLVFPDSPDNTVDVATYVAVIEPEANVAETLKANFALKITGAPTWS